MVSRPKRAPTQQPTFEYIWNVQYCCRTCTVRPSRRRFISFGRSYPAFVIPCRPTAAAPQRLRQTAETLCRGLPALAEYLSYVKSLRPGEPADYSRAERMFTDGLRRRGFPPDVPFDWMHGHHPVKPAGVAGAAAGRRGLEARGKARALVVGGAGGGSGSGSGGGDNGVAAMAGTKRPRADSESLSEASAASTVKVAAVGLRPGIGSPGGHRGGLVNAAVALFDLYADIPPPDLASVSKRERGTDEGTAQTAPPPGAVVSETVPVVTTEPMAGSDGGPRRPSSPGAVSRAGGATLAAADTRNAETKLPIGSAQSSSAVTTSGHGDGRLGGGGNSGGGGGVDVSVAIGKLRPHVQGGGKGSKKFPRACALLADLLSAKLSADNEEIFFGVVSDAVSRSFGTSSGDSGAVVLQADGAVGEAVRRLTSAACARSSLFLGRRREAVEAWERAVVACDGRQKGTGKPL